MEPLTYSNPRMSAVIADWPSSFNKRVTARFDANGNFVGSWEVSE